MVKSEAVGSGIGAFFNNPGALALGALAIGLLFFSGDIRKALGSLGENFGKIELPAINLPDIRFPDVNFPDIRFPDVNFPDFNLDFGNIFGGLQESLNTIVNQFSNLDKPGREEGTLEEQADDPDFVVVSLTDAERRRAQQDAAARAAAESELEATFDDPFFGDAELVRIRNEAEFRRRQQLEIPNRDPTELFNVQTTIDDQQFRGGGLSFIGGTVTETPIEFLSLGQIIDRFGVTASQAADIKARAGGGSPEDIAQFEAFDFGTNTGMGIGSVAGDIAELQNVGQVSDEQFQGLTAEEIALRLTGGNISNF